MAKRSDFAQKLLDDLRSRKERMAASQSSQPSNSLPGDSYAHSKQTYKGSRDTKLQITTGYRSGNSCNRSGRGKKSITSQEVSNQIVPFGRGQSSEQTGDLSVALAFILENGGKLRMDSSGNGSVMDFLNQIGRRSMDNGKIESRSIIDYRPSTSRFPNLSHLHIKEISKGVQKLNQILKTCSNGLNLDRYSIEIGKELLKGAVDLEESLRMLVHLQEASEYMISPQRKSRITLLEDDEDDDDDDTAQLPNQKQLDRPRFSFDKPTRKYHNIQEATRTDIKQRVMALTYSSEATNVDKGNQTPLTSNTVSHKRSTSYSLDVKTSATYGDQKNNLASLKSEPEKGRIPSVIAKLMGLHELPGNVDSKHTTHKDSNSKQKSEGMVSKKAAQESTKKAEKRTNHTENMTPQPVKKKVIQKSKFPVIQHTTLTWLAERNLPTEHANFEVVVQNGKPQWKDFEGLESVTGLKTAAHIDKKQSNTTQLNQSTGIQNGIPEKERKQDNTKHREQRGTNKVKAEEPGLRDQLQQMAQQIDVRSETAVMFKQNTGIKESILRTEKRYSDKLLLGNQLKSQNDVRLQQPRMQPRFKGQEEYHQADEREQQGAKQKLLVRKQRGSERVSSKLSKPVNDSIDLHLKQASENQGKARKTTSIEVISAMPSEKFSNGRHHEDLVEAGSSSRVNINPKDSINMETNIASNPRFLESETEKAANGNPLAMEEKPVQVLASLNAKYAKAHRGETLRRIDEAMTRRNRALQSFPRPLKHLSSNLQEEKYGSHDKLSGLKEEEKLGLSKSKDAQARIFKSNKPIPRIPPLNVAQQLTREAEQDSKLYSPVENECPLLEKPQALAPTDNCQNIFSRVINDQQDQEPTIAREEELNSCKTASNPLDETREESTDISYPSQPKYHKHSKSETPESLTESENHLKQILIKSQLFLNTAEALFKLNIPISILHADCHECLDEDSKLILDCGYEVMRRKGRMQELSVHPCMNVSVTYMKVRSLDDLVKLLRKEFENLKSYYGKNGNNAECVVENCLSKMVESDVHDKDPDVNCMWDSGWHDIKYAFLEKDDVVRDVEKILLNGLINEITLDLIYTHL
ncbi:DUF4378 domain-containing protein [Cephalotus follicularis]|uniref:DUF4378 domain-containing protein n=1 Tax=Cephalotus follicularis TaxID=3775 RepID=A0A1Q3CDA2_CEPFO|nr:DUF4378 domain-containing protein [Cephalotus follicularis]